MIYLIKFILIYFSFYLSFFINKKFKNFDQPGLNKTHKKKVLNSGGIGPMLILTVGILYSMFYGQFEYSDYFYNIPQLWVAPTSILIFTLISFYDDFNYIPYQVRLCVQLSIIYLCISLFPINPEYNFQAITANLYQDGLLAHLTKELKGFLIIVWQVQVSSANHLKIQMCFDKSL